jgi:hypothetical protein
VGMQEKALEFLLDELGLFNPQLVGVPRFLL